MNYLFKRRQDGKLQRTHVEVKGSRYRSVTCQGVDGEEFSPIDSSIVTSEWTQAEGKNLGRSNETSPEQQAESEAVSWTQRKIDNGYVSDHRFVDNPVIKKVAMLAKAFDPDRVQKEIDSSGYVFVQPKFDGIRCVATANGLFARSGKRIHGMKHIEESLVDLFDRYPDVTLDGELYNHEYRDNFNEIVSAVKREKNFDEEKASKIQYHIYDVVSDGIHTESFSDRYLAFEMLQNVALPLVPTVTETCLTQDDVNSYHEQFLSEGYEGTMVRYDEVYQTNKRNWCLQKLKEFRDEEFSILRFEEGRGKSAGLVSTVVVDVDGVEVYATMMGELPFRTQLWSEKDQYVGGTATVKYFNKTKDGSLRFPNCKTVFKGERSI